MNCSSRPVKRCKSVAGRLNLDTSEAGQLAAEYRVVSIEELTPASVTHGLRTLGQIDNVGEQNGREDALAADRRLCAREKFGDLVSKLIGSRRRDTAGDRSPVPPEVERWECFSPIGGRLRRSQLGLACDGSERRNTHVWQDTGDVDHAVHAHQRDSGGRARGGALSPRKPFPKYSRRALRVARVASRTVRAMCAAENFCLLFV